MAKVSGGKKLEIALAKIAALLDQPGTLRVGFLEGATAPNGDSIPLRAAMNEYGHGNVPPRPFFRNMIAAKSGEWPEGVAYQLKATNYDVHLTLSRTAEAIKGQLQESILDLWSPALSPKTIKKKGFEKPLIEHGDMINAVAWEITSAGGESANALAASVRQQLGRVGAGSSASFAGAAKSAKPT